MTVRDTLFERLCEVPVIDTHEHLWDESYRLLHPGDWSGQFYHYAVTALRMAGMSEAEGARLYDEATPHDEKWRIFARYFPRARRTGYLQAALIGLRDVYDIRDITHATMEELTAKIQATVQPGFHRRILRDKAGIAYAMVNCFDTDDEGNRFPARTWGDIELLRPDLSVDEFIIPARRALLARLTQEDSADLSGWLRTIDVYFERVAPLCCALKVKLASKRDLSFAAPVSRQAAEALYAQQMQGTLSRSAARQLEDFLFYYILGKAVDYRLPLKFHTGLHSPANRLHQYTLRDNVKHLAELAVAHPECQFVALHIAYPFHNELAMAVRQVTNLYAEMSWVWVVDPVAAAGFLKQALVAAPLNKVLGFGGDYSLVENAYGHLHLARQGMAGVLADMVTDWGWSVADASEAGRWLLHDAAALLFPQSNGTEKAKQHTEQIT